jgi:hypothetical protein
VQITVNRNGNVIAAIQKEQQIRILGRTSIGNSQKVQMAPDADAPETQIGFINLN